MGLNSNTRMRAVSTADVLRPQDKDISILVKTLDTVDRSSYDALQHSLEQSTCLQRLRHFLKDDNQLHGANSGFRRAGGFQALLRLLRTLVDIFGAQKDPSLTVKSFLQTLSQWFAVLGAALEGHEGNQRYFRTKVDDGGWLSLQATLEQFLAIIWPQTGNDLFLEQFFGVLFATATGVEMINDLYVAAENAASRQNVSPNSEEALPLAQSALKKSIANVDDLEVPELLTLTLALWASVAKTGNLPQRLLRITLPTSLQQVLSASRRNIVSAHTAGAFTAIIKLIFDERFPLPIELLLNKSPFFYARKGFRVLTTPISYSLKQATLLKQQPSFWRL